MNKKWKWLLGSLAGILLVSATPVNGQELLQAVRACKPKKVSKEIRSASPTEIQKGLFLLVKKFETECKDEQHGIEIAQLLLRAGANVNAPDKNGNTPLMLLAARGSAVVPVKINDRGVQTSYSYNGGTDYYPFGSGMAQVFLNYGAEAKQINEQTEYNALMLAANNGNKEVFRTLARSSADYNVTLAQTARYSDYVAVENLLAWGANANAIVKGELVGAWGGDEVGYKPLLLVGTRAYLLANNSIRTAQALIKNGAHINDHTALAGSPICSALRFPDADFSGKYVDFILSHRAFIQVPLKEQDPDGLNTVWACAADYGLVHDNGVGWSLRVLNQLIKAGYDVNEKGSVDDGKKEVLPLLLLMRGGWGSSMDQAAELLRKNGARTNGFVYGYCMSLMDDEAACRVFKPAQNSTGKKRTSAQGRRSTSGVRRSTRS